MSAPALFGDSALTALRSLLEEGFRIRVALTAIRGAERARRRRTKPARDAVGDAPADERSWRSIWPRG